MALNLKILFKPALRPMGSLLQNLRGIHCTGNKTSVENLDKKNEPDPEQKEASFEELLESSPLMKIRRPQGIAVKGKIINICNDDLYVDFGGKFEVVVKRPNVRVDEYQVGTAVRIMLKKFEMTGHFLGQSKHITLLEADGSLMGLEPKKNATK